MKILKNIAISAVVAAVAVSVTYAYFNSQVTKSNNALATGTLNLTVDSTNSYPWSISKFAPGDKSVWKKFVITNTGNLAGWLFISAEKTSGDDDLYNALYTEIRQDGKNGPLVYDGPLSTLNKGPYSLGGTTSTTRFQRIYLPETDEDQNNLQGKNVTFNVVFSLKQY